jgi:hypothetical protein
VLVLVAGIACSNPARGTDVCLCVCVLRCPVSSEDEACLNVI